MAQDEDLGVLGTVAGRPGPASRTRATRPDALTAVSRAPKVLDA
jgi:hypothetical protein